MVDFKAQLAKGYSAHRQASAAKAEVNTVLKELTTQVQEYTNGRVGVALKRELVSLAVDMFDNVALAISGAPKTPPLKMQYNLVAFDTSRGVGGKTERLATWSQDNTGYPCTLRFDDTKREAYDRKSLETILGELLASSEAGRIISSIASQPPKVIEGDTDSQSSDTPVKPST